MAAEQSIRRDRAALKLAAGLGLVAGAVLLAAAPWPVGIATLAPPAVAYAAVFDWSLRRPDAFPAPAAFAVGLLLDVLSGPAFGLGALACVLAHFAAAGQRRFLAPRGLGHAWLAFALTALALAPIAWIVATLVAFQLQPVGPILAQTVLTAAVYPPIALGFAAVRAAIGLGGRSP